MAAHQFRYRLTCAVFRSAVVVSTDVGTGIGERLCALAITAAKDVVDDVVAQDGDISGRHGGSIATAIDVFYTGLVAAIDENLGECLLSFTV